MTYLNRGKRHFEHWAYQETGSALALGAVNTFFLIPFLLLSPIASAMVDRYDRKLMMMVSDLTAVLATAGLLVIHASGHLQIWHLYIAAVVYLFFPVVRNLEDLLTDHDQLEKVEEGIA